MDLVDNVRRKIRVLAPGDYVLGLQAVLQHIETAFRHLSRGQESDDRTAFTDAIYRTNQAFEGSIKEAFRVLTGQDPAHKTPHSIEMYFDSNSVFRPRVLSQFKTYRTEWRNPSTHDYRLDFDEHEAFLAIVSVAAFACLLLDQIAERVASNSAKVNAEAQAEALTATLQESGNPDLLVRLSELAARFAASSPPQPWSDLTEAQAVGALEGFLTAVAPDLELKSAEQLNPDRPHRADLVVADSRERVIVEVKRRFMPQHLGNIVSQVEHYLLISGLKKAVVLFLPTGSTKMEQFTQEVENLNGQIVVVRPEGSQVLRRTPRTRKTS